MFLLTNKALIWVGKGQKKKKPIIITTWAIRERFGTRMVRAETAASKSERYQVRVSSYYKALIINEKYCFRWRSEW